MKPTTLTLTAAASGITTATNWICMDRLPDDIEISFGVTVTAPVSGFGRYTVQHTFVNVPLVGTAAASASAIYNHPTVAAVSVARDGNYAYPVAAIRLQMTGGSAANNSATITVTQGGN